MNPRQPSPPRCLDLESVFSTPENRSDATPIVRDILRTCRLSNINKLIFPPGTYHFRPDKAEETYIFISNNDEGLKRIAFSLREFDEFEIDGQGADFVFHGIIIPFVVQRAHAITLCNFTIDWIQPFHAEATVLTSCEDHVDLEIRPGYRYQLHDGRIIFERDGGQPLKMGSVLEFDAAKAEPAFRAQDNPHLGENHRAEEIGLGKIRLHASFKRPLPISGNILIIKDTHRLCPAIVLDDSDNVTIREVDIYHAGGMGIIAQRCENVLLDHTRVRPSPSGGRMISATADATHFVECRGNITVANCIFKHQMDDPINIHGIYALIEKKIDSHSIQIKLMHRQQYGLNIVTPGAHVEFADRRTLGALFHCFVDSVELINKEYAILRFSTALPDEIQRGVAVTNLDNSFPRILIQKTVAGCNRARGFLLSTRGDIIVEDCEFHVPGAAILIAGDANYWFESGPVNNVKIRRNRFINCNYGASDWGRAIIDVNPEIELPYRAETLFHRRIVIEHNFFLTFDKRVLRAHCVDGLTFRHNRIVDSYDYPAQCVDATLLDVAYCANCHIYGNTHNERPLGLPFSEQQALRPAFEAGALG